MMAVEVRRFAAKEIDEAIELTIQFAGDFVERQRPLLCHLPNPFPQHPVAR